MFARPQTAMSPFSGCSRFRLFLFALSVVVALLGYYFLFDFTHSNAKAMAGELTLGSDAQTTQVLQGSGILAFLFDYCGNFCYVLPLIVIYLGGCLFLPRIKFKEINFFRLGLRLLGFNTLCLGTTALMAATQHTGGILGDFLHLILSALLGANFAALAAAVVTLVGLFLFIGRSPLQLCDILGSQCFALIDKIRGQKDNASKTPANGTKQDAKASAPADKTPDLPSGATIFGAASVKEIAPQVEPERAEPSFGQSVPPLMTPESKVEPQFNPELAPQEPYVEPPAYTTPTPAPTPSTPVEEKAPPRTIITRTLPQDSMPADLDAMHAPINQAAADDGSTGVTTIITKGGQVMPPPEPEVEDDVPHTVITYHQPAMPEPKISNPQEEVHTHIFTSTQVNTPFMPANGQETTSSAPAEATHPALAEISTCPLDEQYAPYEQEESVDSAGPTQLKSAVSGGRILNFADFAKAEESASATLARTPSFEVNTLPDGISAQVDAAPADRLRDDKEHVSEKDLALRFPSASRGVLSKKADDDASSPMPATEQTMSINPVAQEAVASSQVAPDAVQAAEDSVAQTNQQRPESMALQGSNSNTSNLPSYLQNTNNGNTTVGGDNGETFSVPLKTDYVSSCVTTPRHFYDNWRPSVDLLTPPPESEQVDPAAFAEMSARINSFFADFKIKAQVKGYHDGPVITTYALELAPGVRFASINNLVDDLCRVLKVPPHSVRAISSLPGTIYAGLEVPSPKRRLISLYEVAHSREFQETQVALPLCLGENVEGKPVIVDLATAPHLLIAGTTGSGKSAGLNSMLMSLLLKRSPAELRLVLIDPKRLEFALYNNLPHLITPVIADVADKTQAALQWCVNETERRYRLMQAFSVRKIDEYNAIIERAQLHGDVVVDPAWTPDMGGTPPALQKLPYIVVVIEEFADLMAQISGRGKKGDFTPEVAISRITAIARACGIHLILATQTPRAEIITGAIRANMPSRVAFTVQNSMESRIILDESGAECLLGLGDMICKINGFNRNASFRAHGAFVSNSDVLRVVESWQEHGETEYIDGVTELPPDEDEELESAAAGDGGANKRLDPLYDKVKEYALDYYARKHKAVPVSELQTIFSIGFQRARRLVYQLDLNHVYDNL